MLGVISDFSTINEIFKHNDFHLLVDFDKQLKITRPSYKFGFFCPEIITNDVYF